MFPKLINFGPPSPINLMNGAEGLIAERVQNWAVEQGVPQVCISPHHTRGYRPLISTDFQEVGVQAAKHLHEAGYRRLALLPLTEQPHDPDRDRDSGFRRYADEQGLPCECLQPLPGTQERMLQVDEECLNAWRVYFAQSRAPLGLFARNLREAYALHYILLELGVKVPTEVGLIVGGEDPSTLNALKPSLSGIDRNDWSLGYEAAKTLHAMLQGKAYKPMQLVQPAGVIPRDSTRLKESADPFVEQVMEDMRRHLSHPQPLAEIAARFGVSAKTLERRVKEDLHITPGKLMMRLRMERARELLDQESLSISEISEACGFMESSQLSRAFKQHSGQSPREYRRRVSLSE